jgi:hypothetical protein
MTVSHFTTRRLPGLSYTTSMDAALGGEDEQALRGAGQRDVRARFVRPER